MIHGKEGKARFSTSERATVRAPHQWDRGEDDLMEGALRKVKTPDDLVRACEEAGAKIRLTGTNSAFVKGPAGATTIPTKWSGQGRGRANAIAAVRRLGLDFESTVAPPPRPRLVVREESVCPFESEESDDMSSTAPTPLSAIPQRKPSATREDLEAAIDLIETLSGRISTLAARVDKVERRLTAAAVEPSKYDQSRYIRERVVAWFKKLPPGFVAASGTVISNLEPDADKALKSSYRLQMANLAKSGQLRVHGEGAATQYSLNPELDEDR